MIEHILEIQSLIEEQKEDLPTWFVVQLMKKCQEAHVASKLQPKLYRLTWLSVDSIAIPVPRRKDDGYSAQVKLIHNQQTLIVELEDRLLDRDETPSETKGPCRPEQCPGASPMIPTHPTSATVCEFR